MSLDISRLENVRQVGHRTFARCPACAATGSDTDGDNLSIDASGAFTCIKNTGATGAEHRKEIFRLVGMRDTPAQRTPERATMPQAATKPAKLYPSLESAIEAMQRGIGAVRGVEKYAYPENFFIVRFTLDAIDPKTGKAKKEFRPFHKTAAGWIAKDPAGLLPLYHRDEITTRATETVFVTEGERAADALRGLGFLATTSSHGYASANKSDFSPLTGRDVVICPDNDDAGENYAADVTRILHGHRAQVRICRLPGLPAKGDAVEFIQARIERTPEEIRGEIEALVEQAEAWTAPAETATTIANTENGGMELKAKLFSISQQKVTSSEYKKLVAAEVLIALHENGIFAHEEQRKSYDSCRYFNRKQKLLLRIKSDRFQSWLSHWSGLNRSDKIFAYVLAAIEDEALVSNRTRAIVPARFWTSKDGKIYLSCGDGSLVRISARRHELLDNGTDDVFFDQGWTLLPWKQVDPVSPFDSCRIFREMRTTVKHAQALLLAWLVSLPTDPRCKPILVVIGPIGSGKTKLLVEVCNMYGLPVRVISLTQAGESDCWTLLNDGGAPILDNADSNIPWLADLLAAASTGGTSEKRKLYTDSEIIRLKAHGWPCVTSANPMFAKDAGMTDRALLVRLERMDGDTSESELTDEVLRNRDASMSWICTTLAAALDDKGAVPSGLNRRHPDFSAFAVRIGRAIGKESEVIAAMKSAEDDKSLFNLENDEVGAALMALVKARGEFTGTASDMLDAFKVMDAAFHNPYWQAKRVSRRLGRIWPHVQSVFQARSDVSHGGALSYSIALRGDNGDFLPPYMEKVSRGIDNREFTDIGPLEVTKSPEPEPAPGWSPEEQAFFDKLEVVK